MAVVMTTLAGSFAIWGINDIFHGFRQGTLASIGKTEISTAQFRQTYDDRLQQIGRQLGHPLLPDQANTNGLDRQVLGEMIAQAGLDQLAQRIGARPLQHRDITQHHRPIHGCRTSTVNSTGSRIKLFLHDHRRDRPGLYRDTATDRAAPAARRQHIRRHHAAAGLARRHQSVPKSTTQHPICVTQPGTGRQRAAADRPGTEQIFRRAQILFRAPEYRKIDTVTVTPAALAQWMQISDDDIKKTYDERQASFVTPEKRHISRSCSRK